MALREITLRLRDLMTEHLSERFPRLFFSSLFLFSTSENAVNQFSEGGKLLLVNKAASVALAVVKIV